MIQFGTIQDFSPFVCMHCISTVMLECSLSQVVGVEYCGRFTDAAVQIQEGKSVAYTGEDGTRCEAKLPEGAQPSKVVFKQVSC